MNASRGNSSADRAVIAVFIPTYRVKDTTGSVIALKKLTWTPTGCNRSEDTGKNLMWSCIRGPLRAISQSPLVIPIPERRTLSG
jgi:hypothetical protein